MLGCHERYYRQTSPPPIEPERHTVGRQFVDDGVVILSLEILGMLNEVRKFEIRFIFHLNSNSVL